MERATKSETASALQRALVSVRELKLALQRRDEPIAVVGAACRLPGAQSLEALWTLLTERGDAIQEVPPERWNNGDLYDPDPLAPGKVSTRWAGLIDETAFDAAFFGITDTEAEHMDPQQRVFLEVAWEALAHAGQERHDVQGSRTGVYVGVVNYNDGYARRLFSNVDRINAFSGPGVSNSVLAGRVSYLLDLKGPSLVVDTACSSSLVAVHQACSSLRNNECDQAIAGGVNLVLGPEFTIATSRMGLMAADGRCKPFDERADGIVRSDGCGAVVLKRLSDAQRDGDRVLAVIEATALNQDGRTNGMTAPNGLSQQALLRDLLARAGAHADQLGYVEAHGTGTRLGDPIEVGALVNVLGTRPVDAPCLIGSVKGNIGHCEAAAGIASLIKSVLCLHHRYVPGQADLQTVNSHIESSPSVSFVRSGRPWPERDGEPLLGLVSSFGWSGTNAQVLLRAGSHRQANAINVYRLAADTPETLTMAVKAVQARLQTVPPEQRVSCPAGSVSGTVRKAFNASSAGVMLKEMERWLNKPSVGVPGRKIALLFSGQGSQWPGMVDELLSRDAEFRRSLEQSQAILRKLDGWELLPSIAAGSGTDLAQTRWAQPCIVAIQLALFDMLVSWGIKPSAVSGHSVGELSAACCAGILTREQVLQAAVARGKCMSTLHDHGRMYAVLAEQHIVEDLLAGDEGGCISACNSPGASIVSVSQAAAAVFEQRCQQAAIEPIVVNAHYAFHCPLLEPLSADLERAFDELRHSPAHMQFQSSSHFGDDVTVPTDAGYWVRNALRPVRFDRALNQLAESGCDTFIELGPHSSLVQHVQRCLGSKVANLRVWPVLNRHKPLQQTLDTLWAGLFEAGQDLPMLTSSTQPSPAWSHTRFALPAYSHAHDSFSGQSRESIEFAVVWRGESLLADHRIFDRIVVPGAMHLATLVSQALCERHMPAVRVSDIRFFQPLLIEPGQSCPVEFEWRGDQGAQRYQFTVHANPAAGRMMLSGGTLQAVEPSALASPDPLGRSRAGSEVDALEFYHTVQEAGLQLGPLFRRITSIAHDPAGHCLRVDLQAPSMVARDMQLALDPGVLDACFQALYAGYLQRSPGLELYIPLAVDELILLRPVQTRLTATVMLTTTEFDQDIQVLRGDIDLHDADGLAVGWLRNVQLKRATRQSLRSSDAARDPQAWRLEWRACSVATPPSQSINHVVRGAQPTVQLLREALIRAGDGVSDVVGDITERSACVQWIVIDEACPLAAEDPTRSVVEQLMRLREVCLEIDQSGVQRPRLCLITRAPESERHSASVAAASLAMLRVIASEYPGIRCHAVELPASWPPAVQTMDLLLPVLRAGDPCKVHRIANGVLYEQAVRATRGQPQQALAVEEAARYLVTGGFGQTGTAVMQRLIEQGARHISLMGRGRPEAPLLELVASLKEQGVNVHLFQGDVGNRTDVEALMRQVARRGQPLKGIVHLAGVVEDRLIARLQAETIEAVLAPKVSGTLNLLEAAQASRPTWFVMCSSLSAHIGLPGQAAYAAANACAEALAGLHAHTVRTLRVVAWGPWAGGMTARLEERHRQRMATDGLGLMTQAQVLDWMMASSDEDGSEIVASLQPGALERLLGLSRSRAKTLDPSSAPSVTLTGGQEAMRATLRQLVVDELSTLTRHSQVDPDTDLAELALDSLGAVAIVQRLRQRTGKALPITAFFDSRIVDDVVEKLLASA
ncbi:SDR family NAD(P)-dependent oxidoreductase [Pseudomonas sp. S75]|uniref:type I polyketide synthase n=1 Tax=unclassified Pseudomonas TaxID=196821 RepID=UPI0019074674|nr:MULTISPECIES: type I polyketide synthase [unclassified Pseudomonas]MBJ9975375.1 SDR family NAD(P)-dependent oxidoreductase [Pseudomonas sp. S30]MBK0152651.1 SDR family NAD(P)-dependent oxidoreductase [Pseudomonas sp. S75]